VVNIWERYKHGMAAEFSKRRSRHACALTAEKNKKAIFDP